MWCCYNTVTFFHKYPQRTLHSSPGRARYGVSFVDSASVWYSTSVPAVIYAMSCYIGSRYNGTWLYFQCIQLGPDSSIVQLFCAKPITYMYHVHMITISEVKLSSPLSVIFSSKSPMFWVISHISLKLSRTTQLCPYHIIWKFYTDTADHL